jgi:branched-chain amino acid transport system ATP-binding protein
MIEGLTKDFKGLRALDDFNLNLPRYEILGVIGPNGAGKTTLFNLMTGLIPATKGRIVFRNKDITHAQPDVISRFGIARTFQNIRLFNAMTVLDNVRVAIQLHSSKNPIGVFISSPGFLRKEKELEERSMALLKSFNLEQYRDHSAGNLPYGGQRRLEIIRALATGPQLLLLDEPTVGMNPSESQELLELIQIIHQEHQLTIILVAHDMRLVMGLCQRIQVLNQGKTIAADTPAVVRGLPQVVEAYLGSSQHA